MTTLASTERLAPRRAPRLIGDQTLAMVLFVFVEVMLFAGMISGFLVVQSAVPASMWPPPDQPRLPLASTALNSLALLGSGATLALALRSFGTDRVRAGKLLSLTLGLGTFFVVFQGAEWARLLAAGLTMTSSHLGSFFYLIIGCHALHAVAAIALLAARRAQLRRDRLGADQFAAAGVFWGFVVLVWPVLYVVVYLG